MIHLVVVVAAAFAASPDPSGGVVRRLVPIALVAFAVGAAVGFERTRARLGRTGARTRPRLRRWRSR